MKKTFFLVILTLVLGIQLVHADVYVKWGRGGPTIITQEEFEFKAIDNELKEGKGQMGPYKIHYEYVRSDNTTYSHLFDLTEEEFLDMQKNYNYK